MIYSCACRVERYLRSSVYVLFPIDETTEFKPANHSAGACESDPNVRQPTNGQ